MSGRKLALLAAILMLGGALESAFSLRPFLTIGPAGCHVRGRFDGPSFDYADERRLDVPAGMQLRVDNAFGRVQVTAGAPGAVSVRLRKRVFTSEEARARQLAERVRLDAALDGSSLRLGTNRRELDAELREGIGLETSFEIEAPADARVVVVNEHGAVDVRGVRAAELETAHDDVEVERIAGDAQVSVRHGATRVAGVGGPLTIQARHGDVNVRESGASKLDVEHGDVELGQSGPSELRLRHGKATATTIGGDLRFDGDHAELEASEVRGHAVVETSHRDVTLRDVRGDVQVKTQHGEVEIADVTGTARVEASFDGVVLERIAGRVEVALEHGGLRAARLAGGGFLRVSGGDVVLEEFEGPFDVEVHRAGATLVPAGPLVDTLRVETSNGDIRLEVPAGSRCELQAAARFGEVHAGDVADLDVSSSNDERLSARVGTGGAAVTLNAEHGDVHIEGRATETSSR